MKPITATLILCLFFSCTGKKTSTPSADGIPVHPRQPLALDIQTSDTAFTRVESLLEMDRYIVLPQQPVLGEIKRVVIQNDRIYVLDNLPQIACYDLNGKLQYHIASRGAGPREFIKIIDFCIDSERNRLIAYDDQKRKLIYYDLKSGDYQKETETSISPMGIAFAGNTLLFDNADHRNYPDKKEFHYSLLYSPDGDKITGRFFPHNAIAEYDYNLGFGHPFFYNNDRLFYNNRFDKTVYLIEPDGPRPLYQINLPNPVPLSEIERKIDPLQLIESDYSSNLSDLFQCGDLLYFWFTKNKYYRTTFYNLKEKKLVYCGKWVNNPPTEKLPFYYRIRGVYKDRFFSVVEPAAIIYKREVNPDVFPDDLKQITEMDNPVIAFYKVVE